MIPDDATGTPVHRFEMQLGNESAFCGVVLLNKSDGPGRWHWQVVCYSTVKGDGIPRSVTAQSHATRARAWADYTAARAQILDHPHPGRTSVTLDN